MLRGFISRHTAADGGGSGGAGDQDDPPEGKVKPSDILQRYGQTAESALRMAEKLAESENNAYQLREKNRTLRGERDDLKSKQPGDGARVLSKDEATAYDAYVALGKPAAEITAALEASEAATQKLSKLEWDAQIRDAATAHGYSPAALGKLPSLSGKALTLKDEKAEDGKDIKRAYVTADGRESALDAYILEHDPEFLPSLTVTSVPPSPSPASLARGTSFVQQHAGGAPAGDKADQFIKQQEERRKAQTNPLMKQGA